MALARIISPDPEQASELAEYLQSQGYRVEIANPCDSFLNPAELEINLEQHSADFALDYAHKFAARSGADVLVAPGALPSRPLHFEPPRPLVKPEPLVELRRAATAHAQGPTAEAQITGTIEGPQSSPPSAAEENGLECDAENQIIFESAHAESRLKSAPRPALGKILPAIDWLAFTEALDILKDCFFDTLDAGSQRAAQSAHRGWQQIKVFAQGQKNRAFEHMQRLRAQHEEWQKMRAAEKLLLDARIEAQEKEDRERLALQQGRAVAVHIAQPAFDFAQEQIPAKQLNPTRNSRRRDWQMAMCGAVAASIFILLVFGVFARQTTASSLPAISAARQTPLDITTGKPPANAQLGSVQVKDDALAAVVTSERTKPAAQNVRAEEHSSRARKPIEENPEPDVIVRHFGRLNPAPVKKPRAIKQYSDMD